MGLNEAHTYKKLGFLKIVPADVNSALYFIGNGTTFIIISGGLATYGLITDDYRAKSTAMHSLRVYSLRAYLYNLSSGSQAGKVHLLLKEKEIGIVLGGLLPA